MSFSFAMYYKPGYQKRYGQCAICHQGIEAGSRVMIGGGFWHRHVMSSRSHYQCWIDEVVKRAGNWYFANDFVPNRMTNEQKAQLNRLRAKRFYVTKKGGEPNVVSAKLAVIEQQIALVKSNGN